MKNKNIIYLTLTDGVAIYYTNDNNQWHREDGPAINFPDGSEYWWLNGKRHRKDGPAINLKNGYKEYWLNGVRYDNKFNITSDEEWTKIVSKILLLK
jgi:hypothetical protein